MTGVQTCALPISLGPALVAAQGYAAPAVGETYARARALCERLDRPREIVPVLHGQVIYHLVKGRLRLAREIAVDLLQRGEDGATEAITAMGHRLSGLVRFYLGEFVVSRAHLEQALARFDPAHRPFYMSFHNQDHLVTLLHSLSQDLFCLGYLDQARLRSEAAVKEAHKLGHAFSLAVALPGACWVWAPRSREELLVRMDTLIAFTDEHGFPWHRAMGTVYRGWALAGSGQTEEGIALLRGGLAAFRATGSATEIPPFLYCSPTRRDWRSSGTRG